MLTGVVVLAIAGAAKAMGSAASPAISAAVGRNIAGSFRSYERRYGYGKPGVSGHTRVWRQRCPAPPRTAVGANPYGSGAKKGQHGENAAVIVGGVVQAELGHDPADVSLDCLGAQHQELGDALVGPALGDEGEHLAFAAGQLMEGSPLAGPFDQAGHDRWVEHAFALGDALAGVSQDGDV